MKYKVTTGKRPGLTKKETAKEPVKKERKIKDA